RGARGHGELHRDGCAGVGEERRARERGGAGLHRVLRHGPLSAGRRVHAARDAVHRAGGTLRHGGGDVGRHRVPALARRILHQRQRAAHRWRAPAGARRLGTGRGTGASAAARGGEALRRLPSRERAQGVPGMKFASTWNPDSPIAQQRCEAMLARVRALRALEQRAVEKSAEAGSVFEKRGQLLPRERVGLLLDPGEPFLPLANLAGYLQDTKDAEASVPGGGMITGIGFVRGVRCMVVASDSGIEAGAIQAMGLEKILRAQEIALANKLPFLHLVESAGANLMRYRVEGFVQGGALFRNLARLSAAGIPVITVQHGSGTAGGAYMPGLSDIVILVRGRSRAFLAGPPLLKAATGEVATEEELGGAEMHASVSGLGEYLAEDDRHALGIAREVVAGLGWAGARTKLEADPNKECLLGLMPANLREPVDMREVMVRLV